MVEMYKQALPTRDLKSRVLLSKAGDTTLFAVWAAQAFLGGMSTMRYVRGEDWIAAAHASTVALILFVYAILFLLRGDARHRDENLSSRIVALSGTWMIFAVAALPLTWRPGWLLTSATLGMVAAYILVGWALFSLGRNVSIFPETRQLIRNGPYSFVRHPLYSAHIACYVLICLPRLSFASVLLTGIGIASEVIRARNEERLLRSVFHEYDDFAASTPRFLPRLAGRGSSDRSLALARVLAFRGSSAR